VRRLLLTLMILGIAPALPSQDVKPEEDPPFQSAGTVSVTDIPVPTFPASSGTVVLDALITETGKIDGVEVRRDLGAFTQLATNAVGEWKFLPATVAGKPITSRIPIAFTFRPAYMFAQSVPLPNFIPQSAAAIQAEFQPAEVLRDAFPRYPSTTVVSGTVILEVTLSKEGKVEGVKVLHDLPPLTGEAEASLANWRFMAATWNGHAVRSKIVMAFLFPPVYESQ